MQRRLVTALTGALALALTACSDDGGARADISETETSETETSVSLCDPGRGPVTPVGLDDVTYTSIVRTDCLEEPCACGAAAAERVEKLLACDAIGVGWYEGLGSLYMEVVGRDDGACVIDIGVEIEGGIGHHRCRLPLPIAAWPGLAGVLTDGRTDPLDGIASRCESRGSCCLLDGCPNPCTEEDAVPLCPMARVDRCGP